MVEIIGAEDGLYRNVWPPEIERIVKEFQAESWTRKVKYVAPLCSRRPSPRRISVRYGPEHSFSLGALHGHARSTADSHICKVLRSGRRAQRGRCLGRIRQMDFVGVTRLGPLRAIERFRRMLHMGKEAAK
jgi:hypothetical protein